MYTMLKIYNSNLIILHVSVTFGEACTVASDACDVDLGLSCASGQCACTGGQVWVNVLGTLAPGYQCFDSTGKHNLLLIFTIFS